jgi:hypothetical protein
MPHIRVVDADDETNFKHASASSADDDTGSLRHRAASRSRNDSGEIAADRVLHVQRFALSPGLFTRAQPRLGGSGWWSPTTRQWSERGSRSCSAPSRTWRSSARRSTRPGCQSPASTSRTCPARGAAAVATPDGRRRPTCRRIRLAPDGPDCENPGLPAALLPLLFLVAADTTLWG